MPENDILTQFSPKLSHFIVHLLQESAIGISGGRIKIIDLNTSCPSVVAQDAGHCDRFKVVIPFAGQTISWEVLFDSNYPEEPPDFIFGADDADFFPNIDLLQHLVNWDYQEPSSLLRVIEELLVQYKRHQENVISQMSRLNFEYTSLITETEIEPDGVEVHLNRKEKHIGPINFLIKLPVDFTRIPVYIVKLNPGEDAALLLVTFNTGEGTRITPQLYLSPRVERALGGCDRLRIPGFPTGTSMSEYIPDVLTLLRNKVDHIAQAYEKRKEYVAAFLTAFGRSILEYDTEGFTKLSFLFEWNDFFFIVHIELPTYFPKDQPIFTLQSIYHDLKGKPFMEVHDTCPYSPRWSSAEMAERARNYLLGKIGNFQKASVKASINST